MQTRTVSRNLLALLGAVGALALVGGTPARAAPLEAKITPAACREPQPKDTRRCFSADVPEDPAHPEGRHIQLDGYVLPATKPGAVKHALFFFGGGPGQRATDGPEESFFWAKQLPEFDMVAIDQRGTGATPDIRCLPGADDATLQALLIDEWPVAELKGCLKAIDGKADPRLYTTANSAVDIDLERQALGYDKIDLLGGSYGTRISQAYIHLYGDHVRSSTLLSPVAPNSALPEGFARHTEMVLDAVLDLCIEDAACAKAYPDIRGDLAKVRAKLAKGPIRVTYPKGPKGKSYAISPGVVASTIRGALYAPDGAAWVPMALHNLANGDYDDFAAHAVNYRRGITSAISDGLYLSIVCAEDFPLNDLNTLHRDDAGTLYGSFRTDQLATACAIWPHGHDLPELHQLKTWPGPVLITSGQLDPVTPVVYAQRVISQFPNGRLIRLPNQGHGGTEAGFQCMAPLIVQFIETADASKLDPRCAEGLKFPAFQAPK